MTEQEWLACTDMQRMLKFLGMNVSGRKFRLFLVACCRGLLHLLPEPYSREAVSTAERYADGELIAEKLRFAWESAWRSAEVARQDRRNSGRQGATAHDFALALLRMIVEVDPVRTLWDKGPSIWWLSLARSWVIDMEVIELTFLRCIFGNPFNPVTLDHTILAWNDAVVVRLAQVAYEERHLPTGTLDTTRLLILADALEEGGCSDADILDHLRGPGPHVRGCWAVDLLLGKE